MTRRRVYLSNYNNHFYHISDGKSKNKTEEKPVQRFNSNPTNCDDIGKLGHTLNGFYIVNGSDSRGRFVVTFDQFQLQQTGSKKRKGKDSCYKFIEFTKLSQ